MISKAQGRSIAGELSVWQEPRLSALEKAMLKWIVTDPEDKLLDANIETGMMAEYLRRNMDCEVCGVSENMESVRMARSRLRSCDIVYASPGDIPWRDGQFDTVLYRLRQEEDALLDKIFTEILRVLKAGGQLVIGMKSYPEAVQRLLDWVSEDSANEKRSFRHTEVEQILRRLSFEEICWQRTGVDTGVLIAWKHREQPEFGCGENR